VSKSPVVRVHLFVEGRVQGVNFRYNTYQEAIRLGVSGWARNLADGRVEAVYEGLQEPVEQLLAWSRHGPEWARVTNMAFEYEEPRGERGFGIR
jgi:acylphosphatase